ncbi:hypothetical protein [Aureispira anguillae]|uniref:Uncharacterized protein n=1 Tax=Aureispira anguillae TaxID=2864201 RepID=A0A915YGM9_9BACT|nr:hypothetical protein [Aureispira anguillae]BDS12793.1 hypothetical protein AsAng_0035180 [Aureispira anguillae]
MEENKVLPEDLKRFSKAIAFMLSFVLILASTIWYFFASSMGKYFLEVHFRLAVVGGLFIVFGFVISILLRFRKSFLLEFMNSILLTINTLIIIGAIVIILVGCFTSFMSLFSSLYLGLGVLIFSKTLRLTQGYSLYRSREPNFLIDSGILDDNLRDE